MWDLPGKKTTVWLLRLFKMITEQLNKEMFNKKAEYSQLTYIFEIYSHLFRLCKMILQSQKLNMFYDVQEISMSTINLSEKQVFHRVHC